MHCRLLIPDLFPRHPAFDEPLSRPRFPSLETMLARGRRTAAAWGSPEQWLLEAFSVAQQNDWPSAPFALLGEGRAPGDEFWAHAEPVHLRAERDRVLLADSSLLDVADDEARALAEAVGRHFGGELHIEVASARRWYARIAHPPAQPTIPLTGVSSSPVEPGSASIGWHALMNEIQMLLHEHPVNEAREARGAPAINGLWLWGGGRLAEARAPGLRSVIAVNPLARGLAAAAGVRASNIPAQAQRWLDQGEPDGVHLFVLEHLVRAARAADPTEWVHALQSLERDWLEPLAQALGRARIGMVTLHGSGGAGALSVETTRSDLRRFWRRRRPLARYRRPH
jgi:hypothetical protein